MATGSTTALTITGFALILVAACNTPSKPRIYALPPVVMTAPTRLTPLPGALVIMLFETEPILSRRHLAWRYIPPEAGSHLVGNYPNQRWWTSPPQALQQQLIQCLTEARVADLVVPATTRVQPSWILSGRLLHFGQQVTGSPPLTNARAQVAADMILLNRDRWEPLWQGKIASTIELPDTTPQSIPAGVSQALEQFCGQLVQQWSGLSHGGSNP